MSAETETAQSRSTSTGSSMMWLVALLGLWVLVTPFFWGGPDAPALLEFSGGWLYWSNIVTGIVIAALAGYAATRS